VAQSSNGSDKTNFCKATALLEKGNKVPNVDGVPVRSFSSAHDRLYLCFNPPTLALRVQNS
jgi:hypothetical protein